MKKAMTKLKKSLTNNIGIKIIAVLVAAVVWLAVVNVSDPEKTIMIYNVPITMVNEDVITDMGMVYNVESKNSVNIMISGKRSTVSELTAEDFTATASLSELSKVNSIPIDVAPKQNAIARKITIVKQSLQTMTVSVENIEKQEFDVEVEYTGKAADGYVTGDYSLSKKSISIQAPASTLDRIAKVAAVCELNSDTSDITRKCDIVLYDKRGKAIKSKNIKMSSQKTTIYVDILKEKEVPIKVNSIGNPADGYQVSDVVLSQSTVKLMGAENILKNIENLEVNGDIDISGQKKEITRKVNLKNYLPEGVSIDGASEIEVIIKIEKLKTRTYSIKLEDIDVENLKDGLSADITDKSVKIVLRGEKDVMDKVNESDIRANIDLKGYGKGTSKVPVVIVIPDGTELTGQVTVKVKIK